MSWMDSAPRSVNEQFVEYAETGRLLTRAGQRTARRRNPFVLYVITVAVVCALFGAGVATLTLGANGSLVLLGAASLVAAAGIAVMVFAAGTIHDHAVAEDTLEITPAAMLPPNLVRTGNWILRDDVWVRVQEIGRDGGGRINALLSDGDVVTLDAPVMIGGGEVRHSRGPFASRRR